MNSYLFADVLNDRRHLLIDPGHIFTPSYRESGLDTLGKNMETDGLSMQAIGLIILTHAHSDHCEAAKVIRDNNNALVKSEMGLPAFLILIPAILQPPHTALHPALAFTIRQPLLHATELTILGLARL
ncbi:MBL fold metallo-hydrolase [Chloroflexota bacterium]